MKISYSVSPDIVAEFLGDQVVALAPQQRRVVHLDGEAAKVFSALYSGREPAAGSDSILESLADDGLIVSTHPREVSRRAVIASSAVGVGSVAAALALPTVAAASSAISVTGQWYISLGPDAVLIEVFGFNFPNRGDYEDPAKPKGSNRPSSLQVDGYGGLFPVRFWKSSGSKDLRYVTWLRNDQPEFFNIPRTLTGTFTWGESTYRARLDFGGPFGL